MPCVIDTANNETLKTQTNQMNNNKRKHIIKIRHLTFRKLLPFVTFTQILLFLICWVCFPLFRPGAAAI